MVSDHTDYLMMQAISFMIDALQTLTACKSHVKAAVSKICQAQEEEDGGRALPLETTAGVLAKSAGIILASSAALRRSARANDLGEG